MELRRLLKKRWVSVLVHVLGAAAIFFAINGYQTRRHLSTRAAAAPEFTLTDLSGRSVSLAEFRGKKVILHFFATWCGVCKVEEPSVRGFFGGLDEDEVLLAIAEDSDDVDALRRYAREHELNYPILLGTREVIAAYGVSAYPTNYYLNGDGTVSSSTVGLSTRVGMEVRTLIASR